MKMKTIGWGGGVCPQCVQNRPLGKGNLTAV